MRLELELEVIMKKTLMLETLLDSLTHRKMDLELLSPKEQFEFSRKIKLMALWNSLERIASTTHQKMKT